jgi:hypothetical protein
MLKSYAQLWHKKEKYEIESLLMVDTRGVRLRREGGLSLGIGSGDGNLFPFDFLSFLRERKYVCVCLTYPRKRCRMRILHL